MYHVITYTGKKDVELFNRLFDKHSRFNTENSDTDAEV